jgi:hypothetical protein
MELTPSTGTNEIKYMTPEEKQVHYARIIIEKLAELFDKENEDCLDLKKMAQDDDITHFIHALGNLAPTYYYCRITGEKISSLMFNHIANQLCFQFSERPSEDKIKEQ